MKDAMAIQYLILLFCSSDWFWELFRERLAEVYPRATVDRLLPVGTEHLFNFDNMVSISDDELKRIGMFEPDSQLFKVPKELLNLPY